MRASPVVVEPGSWLVHRGSERLRALVALSCVVAAAACSSRDRQNAGSEAVLQREGGGEVGAGEDRAGEAVAERFSLIPSGEGLEPEHAAATPLLEQLSYIPAQEHGDPPTCHAKRIYGDGTLYLLTSGERECTGRWHRLTSLTEEGQRLLLSHFAALCGDPELPPGETDGSIIYRVTTPECTRQFFVRGIPTHAQSRLVEGTNDVINRHLVPIPPDPAPAP